MTERKPADMTFTSWIDKQIAEAAERGAFDNLPGAGKPIPHHGDEDATEAWLRGYLRREGLSPEVLLPPPLRLRKQADRLEQAVPGMRSLEDVRAAVGELNDQIREWRRIPVGPPIFVPLVDEQAMVSRWHAARAEPEPVPPVAAPDDTPPGDTTPGGRGGRRGRRWFGREQRRRR